VVRDFVFVEDVVDALVAAATDQSGEWVFNIGGGRGRSLREIIAAIERQMGKTLRLEWKPGRPLDVPVSVVAIDRAAQSLGWMPSTSFETGLGRTIEWAKKALPTVEVLPR
jgi:UDP-glucose 4-epimerase